jgi:hypothetical protein
LLLLPLLLFISRHCCCLPVSPTITTSAPSWSTSALPERAAALPVSRVVALVTYTHTLMNIHTLTHATYTHLHTHLYTHTPCAHFTLIPLHTHLHTLKHTLTTHLYTHIFTHIFTHTYTHTCY